MEGYARIEYARGKPWMVFWTDPLVFHSWMKYRDGDSLEEFLEAEVAKAQAYIAELGRVPEAAWAAL